MVARINNADVASFSILALRQAEALQKWKEITQSVIRWDVQRTHNVQSLNGYN